MLVFLVYFYLPTYKFREEGVAEGGEGLDLRIISDNTVNESRGNFLKSFRCIDVGNCDFKIFGVYRT